MILQVSPDAPAAVQLGAAALLYLHIGGAALGLASGPVAMLARKGQRLHRLAGKVFFASMLAMAGVGAAVAPFLPTGQWTNTTAGIFTIYLVATSWAAVKRKPGEIGRLEVAAFLVGFALSVMGLTLAAIHAGTPKAGAYNIVLALAVTAGFAAAWDLRAILRGGLSGAARIARHLWRMSLALAIAFASFAGQPLAQPEFLRGSPIVFLPALAVLGLMAFWMVRVRWPRRRAAAAADLDMTPATSG